MSNPQLQIKTFVEPTFGENAYLLSSTDATGRKPGGVIDPSFPPQVEELIGYARGEGIEIEKIVLTHGHADHIAGVDFVKQAFPSAQVLIAAEDAAMLADAERNLSAPFGMSITLRTPPDGDLVPGTTLQMAGFNWRIFDTSGHSPGGRSLYCREVRVVFSGDALFAGSIGRYDFPGSDGPRLLGNIRMHLLTLPDETVVYSGHGPKTTIRNERKFNPYLSD